jgi:hypothetical protein
MSKPTLSIYEVPIVYRGQSNFLVLAESPERAAELAEESFKKGKTPDTLGNEWEEIERIGNVTPYGENAALSNDAMPLSKKERDRLVEILRNTATSCHDAQTGVWDKSEDGFDALQNAAEEGLEILHAPLPEYDADQQGATP